MVKCQCGKPLSENDMKTQIQRLRVHAGRLSGIKEPRKQSEWARRQMPKCEGCVTKMLKPD